MPSELLERASRKILESQKESQDPKSPKSPEEAKEISDILHLIRSDCEQLLEENGVWKNIWGGLLKHKLLTSSIDINSVPVRVSISSHDRKPPKESWEIAIFIESLNEHLVFKKYGSPYIGIGGWHWREVTKEDAKNYQEVVNLIKENYQT